MLIHRRDRNPDPTGSLPYRISAKIGLLNLKIPLLVLIALTMPPGMAVTLSHNGLDAADGRRLTVLTFLCWISFGSLVFYPAAMDTLADQIRHRGRRMAARPQGARPDQIVDVSSRAQRASRQALSLFMLEFVIFETIILRIVGWGILTVLTVGGGVTLVLTAGGVALLRWLRRRTGIGHSPVRGRRSIAATFLVILAACYAVAGLFFLMSAGAASADADTEGGGTYSSSSA